MSANLVISLGLIAATAYFGAQAYETPATKRTAANPIEIFSALASTPAFGEDPMPSANGNLTIQQVYNLAQYLIGQYGFNVTPEMATSIAIVESGSVTLPQNGCNPKATRYESALNDSSAGLMQVLSTTGKWLANSEGYNGFSAPSVNDLLDAQTGMYFGLAYLDYLSKYNGTAQSESFIVQGYNAGPGNSSSSYLAKYNQAKAWLQQNGY